MLTIAEPHEARSTTKVKDTWSAMLRGVPFIASAVLHNPDNKTYGIADLLVRSDWLRHLVSVNPYTADKPPHQHHC